MVSSPVYYFGGIASVLPGTRHDMKKTIIGHHDQFFAQRYPAMQAIQTSKHHEYPF
jgi:hypothetical protein